MQERSLPFLFRDAIQGQGGQSCPCQSAGICQTGAAGPTPNPGRLVTLELSSIDISGLIGGHLVVPCAVPQG